MPGIIGFTGDTEGDDFDEVCSLIEAQGGDPGIIIPLMGVLSDAAAQCAGLRVRAKVGVKDEEAAKARGEGVASDPEAGRTVLSAAIHYGRVVGVLDCLEALGEPGPSMRPSEIVDAAEQMLTDPAAFADQLAASREAALAAMVAEQEGGDVPSADPGEPPYLGRVDDTGSAE
jgi:hypothetical protein